MSRLNVPPDHEHLSMDSGDSPDEGVPDVESPIGEELAEALSKEGEFTVDPNLTFAELGLDPKDAEPIIEARKYQGLQAKKSFLTGDQERYCTLRYVIQYQRMIRRVAPAGLTKQGLDEEQIKSVLTGVDIVCEELLEQLASACHTSGLTQFN